MLTELRAKPALSQRIHHVTGELHGCRVNKPGSPRTLEHRRCADALAYLRSTWPRDMRRGKRAGEGGSFVLVT